jgi:hypothetical protein
MGCLRSARALLALTDPHSRTSVTWPSATPFKPEIVMEAGNRAASPRRARPDAAEQHPLR